MTEHDKPNLSNHYQTEKLAFAAYLISAGKSDLLGVKQVGGGRTLGFLLSEVPSEEDVAAFFNGSGMVSALRYSESLANLKSAIFEAKRAIAAGVRHD